MEELIIKLLDKPDKTILLEKDEEEIYFINDIRQNDNLNTLDLIEIDLRKNENIYKSLVIEKGKIYPIPKEFNLISIKKLSLKYDREYNLRLYVEGDISIPKSEDLILNKITKTYFFDSDDIFSTITDLTGISNLSNESAIFQVLKIENHIADIQSISGLDVLKLNINQLQINKDDFLWINFFESYLNKILVNKLTMFEKLDNTKLAEVLNYSPLSFKGVYLLQVIDIDKDNIILIDSIKTIYQLNKIKNKNYIKKDDFCFCSFIIISRFHKDENNNIIFDEKSFIHPLKNELYYNKNLLLNSYVIFKFYFLDFNIDKNMYDTIYYDLNQSKKIEKDIEYLCITDTVRKQFEYSSYELIVRNSEDKKINDKRFLVYGYHSLINKINVFLNTKNQKTYFYEYFYYNLDNALGEISKKLLIDGKEYNILNCDNFGSLNRKRISIMNIPYQQNEVPEKDLKSNSIQICELIQNNFHKIIGIYDIPLLSKYYESNNFFNQYYENYGDIYDNIIKNDNYEEIAEFLFQKNKNFCKEKFKINLRNGLVYDNKMTLSQFKARIGLIICSFFQDSSKTKNEIIEIIILIKTLDKMFKKKKKLNHSEIIRIIIFVLNEKIIKNSMSYLDSYIYFFSDLEENSPYNIAYNFNKDLIKNLDEFKELFQAYLQLNSYKSYNYINSRETYNFSLESEFMIKHNLLLAYEDFFYIKILENGGKSFLDDFTGITVINEATIFKNVPINIKGTIRNITDIRESKKYAMPIFIYLLHEKTRYYKYNIKNTIIKSPIIYYRGLKVEIIIGGESGEIIKKFVCADDEIMDALCTKIIFGEFLDIKYFDGEGHTKFIEDAKKKLNIYNNEQKSDNIYKHPFVQMGDLIYDVNIYKEMSMISEEQKRKKFEENSKIMREKLQAKKKEKFLKLNNKK